MNEFNKARNDDSIAKPENDTEYDNEDLKLFEIRNSCVARADHFYSNAHFSSAIKECQELTDELRVSKLYQPEFEFENIDDLFLTVAEILKTNHQVQSAI